MSERFARRCKTHVDREVIQIGWRNLFRCASGHEVSSWVIVDLLSGRTIGRAHFLNGGLLFPGALEPTPAPVAVPLAVESSERCPRGHVGQWMGRADNRGKRCRQCRRADGERWRRVHRLRQMVSA